VIKEAEGNTYVVVMSCPGQLFATVNTMVLGNRNIMCSWGSVSDLANNLDALTLSGSAAAAGHPPPAPTPAVAATTVAPASVSFTDIEGDVTTLQLKGRSLSWHSGGRCYLSKITQLKLTDGGSCIIAPEHSALIARLVEPAAGPDRDQLLRDITAMAGAAGAALIRGAVAPIVSFVDMEGDRSTIRLDPATNQLSWFCDGRCHLKKINSLKLTKGGNCIVAPENSVLTANLVKPPRGPDRECLVRDLARMARHAGVRNLEGFP
jgi:hypothetical protein